MGAPWRHLKRFNGQLIKTIGYLLASESPIYREDGETKTKKRDQRE